jgi:two-component system nitrate/nitrite response regulator NarP
MNRILIADDHPIMLSGLEAILAGSRYEVVGKASNGAAVLEALPRARPHILLLDVQMPERTGMDVLRTLRSRGDLRPVVLLTAHLDDHNLVEALQLGVQGILLKEGAQNQLISCLDAVGSGGRWIEKELLERALDLTMSGAARPPDRFAEKVYLHRIYEKLGVSSRTELAIAARERASG